MSLRTCNDDDGRAGRCRAQHRLPILHLGQYWQRRDGQLFSAANRLIGGELDVGGSEVLDEVIHRLGVLQALAQPVDLVGRGLDDQLLNLVNLALLEEGRVVVVVLLDLDRCRLAGALADLFEVGARNDVASRRFHCLHHTRLPIDLHFSGLLHRQLLVDQSFEHTAAGFVSLLGLEPALLLQNGIDLVNGDLFLVHLGGRLRSRLVLGSLVATATQKRGRSQRDRQRDRGFHPVHLLL